MSSTINRTNAIKVQNVGWETPIAYVLVVTMIIRYVLSEMFGHFPIYADVIIFCISAVSLYPFSHIKTGMYGVHVLYNPLAQSKRLIKYGDKPKHPQEYPIELEPLSEQKHVASVKTVDVTCKQGKVKLSYFVLGTPDFGPPGDESEESLQKTLIFTSHPSSVLEEKQDKKAMEIILEAVKGKTPTQVRESKHEIFTKDCFKEFGKEISVLYGKDDYMIVDVDFDAATQDSEDAKFRAVTLNELVTELEKKYTIEEARDVAKYLMKGLAIKKDVNEIVIKDLVEALNLGKDITKNVVNFFKDFLNKNK